MKAEQQDLFAPKPKTDPFGDVDFGFDDDGLRYYQRDAVEAAKAVIEKGESPLLVLATGTGKSVLASSLAKWCSGRVLFVAHRDLLIDQAAKHLERMCGERSEIEQGPLHIRDARLCVASVQSLSQDGRLKRFAPDEFDLIIIDEAHRATSPSYRKFMKHFTCPKVGLTATPDRQDEAQLLDEGLFDEVAYLFDIADAIRGGWLVLIRAHREVIEAIDLRRVKTAESGEFLVGQLDDEVLRGVEGIVHKILELGGKRERIIVFWPGVTSAQYANEVFNREVPGCSGFVCGDKKLCPGRERESTIDAYRAGRIRVLNNVDIATEGFDVPAIDCVAMARMTKSRRIYSQSVGRGTRPLHEDIAFWDSKEEAGTRRANIARGSKPDLLLLDFVGVVGEHKLVTPMDLLSSGFSKEVVERAKKAVAERPVADAETVEGEDVLAALNAAKLELDALKATAQSVQGVTVTSRGYEVDPFAGTDMDEEKLDAIDMRYGSKPATKKQVEALRRAGVSELKLQGLTKRKASSMFDALGKRRELGLATQAQLNVLKKFIAVDQSRVTFDGATATIDYLASVKWRNPDPRTLDRLLYYRHERKR